MEGVKLFLAIAGERAKDTFGNVEFFLYKIFMYIKWYRLKK